MVDRYKMIAELADAAVTEYKGAAPLTRAFDEAVSELILLKPEELQKRYEGLKQIDADGTDYEIVYADQDQHFLMT